MFPGSLALAWVGLASAHTPHDTSAFVAVGVEDPAQLAVGLKLELWHLMTSTNLGHQWAGFTGVGATEEPVDAADDPEGRILSIDPSSSIRIMSVPR